MEKAAFPLESTRLLKWYEVREPAREVADSVRRDARAVVDGIVDADDVGFVILHRCGVDFYFLLLCRWRNDNELWETVLARSGDAPFEVVQGGDTRATFCVWELGVVDAERRSWSELLRSDRGDAAFQTYRETFYSGAV